MTTTIDAEASDLFTSEGKTSEGRWPLLERRDVMVTPSNARIAYDKYQFRRQREISRAHVAKYAEAMRSGTFKPGTVITLAKCDAGEWLVDGNHTLLAVESSGINFLLTIERRSVEDEADAAALYATFEARKRTLGAHMMAAGLDERTGVSPTMLSRFSSGLKLLELEFPEKIPRLIDSVQHQELVSRWAQWAKPVADILAGAPFNTALMTKAGCVALMFLTMRYQPKKAESFWRAIAHNEGLSKGMPQHTAFLELTNGSRKPAVEVFASLSLAWNAYFDDKQLCMLRVFCGPIRVTVKGTPWANKKTGSTKTEPR